MALVTCGNVSLAYEGAVVVRGVSFSIEGGELVGILGENGSGKTTLIKGILRLLKPVTGSFVYGEGFSLRQAAYLPQQTAAQKDFPASVEEIVLSGRISAMGLRPFYNANDRQIALENIKKLHLDGIRHACYRELSGGQQKRALFARALSAIPRLLVLDEPVGGLDQAITNEVYALMDTLRLQGTALVMVTHDIAYILKNAQKIIHLFPGGCWAGSSAEYAQTALFKKWGCSV
ncbi:MAG: metal ABC transporter ATP-binding protein [Spirochaetaceae bacterium]|jgi:zinc transport system ATP-binding protein|nr:metal ABC transporter ATP-binding protein [Spirochaetaceae bacterium]